MTVNFSGHFQISRWHRLLCIALWQLVLKMLFKAGTPSSLRLCRCTLWHLFHSFLSNHGQLFQYFSRLLRLRCATFVEPLGGIYILRSLHTYLLSIFCTNVFCSVHLRYGKASSVILRSAIKSSPDVIFSIFCLSHLFRVISFIMLSSRFRLLEKALRNELKLSSTFNKGCFSWMSVNVFTFVTVLFDTVERTQNINKNV